MRHLIIREEILSPKKLFQRSTVQYIVRESYRFLLGAGRILPLMGGWPFCRGSFSKSRLVLGGHFQIKGAGGHFNKLLQTSNK